MNTKNISSYFKQFTVAGSETISNFQTPNFTTTPKVNKFKTNKIALIGGAIILVLAAFTLGSILSPNRNARIAAPAPTATQTLNREFNFPLKDSKGKTVSNVNYVIQTVNLQDSFIYQGKLAEAVKGRTFMIMSLKITNPYDKPIQINARDYIRVRMNGTDEQLAPEIHNDPVQIDAKATKYTRVGLPINDTDKDLELLVGEIAGPKQTIKLNLSN